MQRIIKLVLILNMLVCNVFSQPTENTGWVLERNENGIKIFTRFREGSEIKEFKAITTVDIDINKINELVDNIDTYTQWMANTKENYTLKRIDKNTRYDYFVAELPWPMRNRDNILLVTKTRNPQNGQIIMTLKGVPDYKPGKPGLVRMPYADGQWQFTPVGRERVEVIYKFMGDPGGSMPAWAINLFLVEGPYQTLSRLKEFALKAKN